ncbi:dihydrofolate reductase [Yersinia enterocolitica]
MKLSCIVATDKQGGIGKQNHIPWYSPSDLKYFKSVTLGKPVIMGRKTFESLPNPLPGRLNIVLSKKGMGSTIGDSSSTVIEVATPAEALDAAKNYWDKLEAPEDVAETFILGGASVYKLFEELYDRVYLTRMDITTDADTYFNDNFLFGLSSTKNEWVPVKDELLDPTEAEIPQTRVVYHRATSV